MPAIEAKKPRCDGSRLIKTPEGFNAMALLRQGFSTRKAAGQTGISVNGALALKRYIPAYETQLQAIDQHYRDRSKLLAWRTLDEITPAKFKKASLGELVKASHDFAKAAGLITQSSQGPQHIGLLNQFFVNAPSRQQIAQPTPQPVDITPDPPENNDVTPRDP